MVIDVLEREDLPFPHSLPEFQRLFPDEAVCAEYLERTRWRDGFVCPHCAVADKPRYVSTRLKVLRCRHCRCDTRLTAGTVMERTHTPLSVWFWGAYLVANQTPGMSAVQFPRQRGLLCYETAFQILHKLRVGMVRPDQDRIGGKPDETVEADETTVKVAVPTWAVVHGAKGAASTTGCSWHAPSKSASASVPAASTSERPGGTKGASASRWCRTEAQSRWSASSKAPWWPGATIITDDWSGYAFRSLLGIAGDVTAPTYADLYAAKSRNTTSSGRV